MIIFMFMFQKRAKTKRKISRKIKITYFLRYEKTQQTIKTHHVSNKGVIIKHIGIYLH
jgi:hypothetical protein